MITEIIKNNGNGYMNILTNIIQLGCIFVLFSVNGVWSQPNLNIEDHSGFDREMWPITGGIPFPKGAIFDINQIGIAGAVSQKRILSRWSDGSIKWVLLDYQKDLGANRKAIDQVLLSEKETNGLAMHMETEDFITVDTGILKFSISKRMFGFLDEAWLDLNKNGIYEPDEQLVNGKSGQSYFMDLQTTNPVRATTPYSNRNLRLGTSFPATNAIPTIEGGPEWMRSEGGGEERRKKAADGKYSAKVIEAGPLRTVVEIKGRLGASEEDSDYTIWVHAYKGKSFIRVQHNFVFRGDPQITNIRRMGLSLPLNFKTPPRFQAAGLPKSEFLSKKDTAYLFNTGPHNVFNLEHNGFTLDWEVGVGKKVTQGTEKTSGWIDVSSDKFGVTISIKDMAYMYPKELSYISENKTLNAWLWPDHGDLVLDLRASGWSKGMQGVSFTHDVFYAFHGPEDQEKEGVFASLAEDSPQPFVNPEWYGYKGTKAAGMIMPQDNIKFPKTEAFLATGTTFIDRSAIEFGWLGMLNYGDMMFMYAYQIGNKDLGTWGISNRKDDYDGWRRGNTMISYRKFMQYLRTGQYEYWKSASAHLKFIRDALIKHYSSEDSTVVGFGRRHSAYWGVTPQDENDRTGGVAWDGYGTNWLGHYLHWNLTGDWRTYEVMNEIRSAWNHWGNTDVDQLSGGAYVGLKTFGSVVGYEQAKKEADNFLVSAVKRTSIPGDEWRDNTWFMGYGLYLQDEEDPVVEEAILDWWKANKHNKDMWGLYWHRESMAAVYWAARNEKEIRESVYSELSTLGSIESQESPRITAQRTLYENLGISGLFNCDMVYLANAVAPKYWRAKDDIMQLQWDEPLGMAVIDHYREYGEPFAPPTHKEKEFDVRVTSSTSNTLELMVTLKALSDIQLDVLNKTGKVIWQFKKEGLHKGEVPISFKGDSDQEMVEGLSEVYFVRLQVGDDRIIKKFTLY
ncbi:exo-rhamnogalacturonan lyase family protein [Confluentibacter flavum]|uniref:PcRGLX/YetA-like central beta-sandwich domain-containing protein n=1 Tax=Confluentibacter flavum TaxID=1909700 RepID=A0A2N3HHJ9_9FLAO|nr:hypothetical protein [Confluentibacter flavum]PKQ44439.1 hypothetical protein CSW08_13590 [Confluentibacter flavum]